MRALDLLERAVSVDPSKSALIWLGKVVRTPSVGPQDVLLESLAQHLYAHWYVFGRPSVDPLRAVDSAGLGRAYDLAHPKFRVHELGWRIRNIESNGAANLERGRLRLRAEADDWTKDANGGASLRLPLSFHRRSPGYYVPTFSRSPQGPLSRLYLAGTPETAFRLVRDLEMFEEAAKPIHVKVASTSEGFDRADAVVFYFASVDAESALSLLEGPLHDVVRGLRAVTPALTRPLAPGVGYAEDPGDGSSFGRNRCQLLADVLLKGMTGDEQLRPGWTKDALLSGGLDPRRPYLRPDAATSAQPPPRLDLQRYGLPNPTPASPAPAGDVDEALVRFAKRVYEQLAETAIRHEDRATWVSPPIRGSVRQEDSAAPILLGNSLDATYYGGLSGVAEFLARFGRSQASPGAMRLAAAAVSQAQQRIESCEPIEGYFTGLIGSLCGVVRAGTAIDLPKQVRLARDVLERVTKDPPHVGVASDLLSGVAGSVLALVTAFENTGDAFYLDMATDRCGTLMARRVRGRQGDCWHWPSSVGLPWLSGMSHGSTGIAYCLTRLAEHRAEVCEPEDLSAILTMEDTAFSSARSNWRDHRTPAPNAGEQSCALTWCHGAPGMLPARRRIRSFLGEKLSELESSALAAFSRELEATNEEEPSDFSLCHGLLGLTECIRLACGAERPTATALAKLTRHHVQAWPLGVGPGWGPGLMLGASGIGWAALGAAVGNHPLAP